MSEIKGITINGREIGFSSPCYFIADIAANHDGDLGRAKELIYKAADAGADAAKFQHFTADSIVSDKGFKSLGGQKSHQASWGKSVFEVYKDASVSLSWTEELVDTCKKAGIDFFTSPYSKSLVDAIDPYVPAYKIGSGDITWIELIQYIAQKGKPTILATGASTMEDVVRGLDALRSINSQVCLMQCNTNYTAELENFKFIHLNVLKTYKEAFPDILLGLSDHTPGHATVLGAIALGARMIEKHFTDDCGRPGPDHKFSMDPKSWKEMVARSRELELALGAGIKQVEANESETVVLQRRSIRAARDIKKGEILNKEDLTVLRPCPEDGLPPYEMEKLIGLTLGISIEKGECIKWNHLNAQ